VLTATALHERQASRRAIESLEAHCTYLVTGHLVMYIRTWSFSQKDSFSRLYSRVLKSSSLVALRPSSLVVIRHLSFVSRLLSPVVLRRSYLVRLYSRSKSTPCFPSPFLKRTPNPKFLTSLNSYPASCLATADYATYVQILTWFFDSPSMLCPFSVHRMALAGTELGKDVGQ
jgi:hypothetical protein